MKIFRNEGRKVMNENNSSCQPDEKRKAQTLPTQMSSKASKTNTVQQDASPLAIMADWIAYGEHMNEQHR